MNSPVQEVIFNFIWYCFWIAFLSVVLVPRLSMRATALIALAAYIPYVIVITGLRFLSLLRGLTGPVILLILTIALYRDRWYRKLLGLVSIAVAVLFSELLIAAMLTPEQIAGGIPSLEGKLQAAVYFIYLFVGASLLIGIAVVWKRFTVRYPWNLPMGAWLVFFLFPFSQYILANGWIRAASVTGSSILQFLLIMLLCSCADIGLLIVLLRTGRNAMLEARSTMLEEQLLFQKQYYAALNEQYFTIRRLRHDLSNHITAIRQLLQNGSPVEASRYAQQLLDEQAQSGEAAVCADYAAAAFLSGKKQELEKRGIALKLSVELPAENGIEQLDLITALGNLIDNAAEACESSLQERTIDLEIRVQSPYVMIKTENAYDSEQKKQNRIPGLERGMGTQILQKLAADYDGSFDMQRQDGCCRTRLMLKARQT